MKDYIKTILNGLLIYLKEKFYDKAEVDNKLLGVSDSQHDHDERYALKDEYEIHTHSWNDLEDKPFGEKTEMVEIVPEQSFSAQSFVTLGNYVLEIGKTYYVTYNGTHYTLQCFGDEGYPTIGSAYEDHYKTYPFSIYNEVSGSGEISPLTIERGTDDAFTLAIYEEQEVVQQIDPKFVGGGMVVTFSGEDFNDLIADKTASELITAIENGVRVSAKMTIGDDLYFFDLKQLNVDSNELIFNCNYNGNGEAMFCYTIPYSDENGALLIVSKITAEVLTIG